MRRLAWIFALLLAAAPAAAQTWSHVPVPAANATFLTDLQTHLKEEAARRFAEQFSSFVSSGGYHGTSAGLTGTPGTTVAYPGGYYINETASITYPDGAICWVIAHKDKSGAVTTFARVAGTHYALDCSSGTQPATPTNSTYLMKVTTSGGAITAVTDLRLRVPGAIRIEAVASLPSAGTAGRLAWVDATKAYYVDTGLAWVRISAQASSAALPAGAIPFADSTGALTQDSANLSWDDTSNQLSVGGTFASTKACASGFTRVGPNFCRKNTITISAWTDAIACTGRTNAAYFPADAKAAYIAVDWAALANNGTGTRGNDVKFYSTAACTAGTNTLQSVFYAYEQAATAAGTVLSRSTQFVLVPLPATDTFYTTQTNAGGNGNADIQFHYILGYLD